jgi:hypothetical protein
MTTPHADAPTENCHPFYRKPGKLGATTRAVWIGIIMRRSGLTPIAAAQTVDDMIGDGRLVRAED